MDVEKIIREYIPNLVHMSLSTSRDNKPWTCEVHFAYDDDLKHLYVFTMPSSRHGEEIALNPFVSGNIVRQHADGEKPRGVYFEGQAKLLANVTENDPGYKIYSERFNGDKWLPQELAKPDGNKLYEITVSDWYVFDAIESKPAQKYHLEL